MCVKRARDRQPIRGNTFDEVRRGLRNAAIAMEPELKIGGEKWEAGHLLEAITADYLTVGRGEQVRRALRGQRVVEAIRLREKAGAPLSVADAPENPATSPVRGPDVDIPLDRGPSDEKNGTAKVKATPKRPIRK